MVNDNLPLIISTHRASDILKLIELKEKYSLNLIIKGAQDASLVASQMKVDFRGLPDKSGSYNRVKKLLQGKIKAKNYFDMKLGLKLGISVREDVELNEGLLQSLRRGYNMIRMKVRRIYGNLISSFKKFIFDSFSSIKNIKDVFSELIGKDVSVTVKFKI